jgi:putative transposase
MHGDTAPWLQRRATLILILNKRRNILLMERLKLLRPVYPRRPARLSQLFATVEPFYFITFNAYRRRAILANAEVHEQFRTFCQRAYDEHGVAVGRYVIMPDHVHLFVHMPPEGILVAKWIEAFRTVLGKQLLHLGVQKPHWQEGFFDHVMRGAESSSQKWDYVRMNPVRAGLCKNPEDWPYQGEIVPLRFD